MTSDPGGWRGPPLDVTDSPFFAVLKANLTHLGQRQRLIAENIANATTPGYMPRDTNEKSFDQTLQAIVKNNAGGKLALAPSEGGLIGARALSNPQVVAKVVDSPDSETTIDGNAVVLEDQMMKQSETRTAYETSIALYEKGLQMLRLAAKAPGR
jgi:flagellar basal-body rod protein FlgB